MTELDIQKIRALRATNRIHFFQSIDSTMTEAARLAEAGAEHGTVVLGNEQSAGVGRLGRSWLSPADSGIYCSILLRLELAPASLPIASLLVGLAAADAIQRTTNLLCDLRWPNDVLIGERKVAGILTHLLGSARQMGTASSASPERRANSSSNGRHATEPFPFVNECVIAGIGINVNQLGFPADLRTPATSLRIECNGREQAREPLVVHLLESVEAFCDRLRGEGVNGILRAFSAASSYARHRRVIVEESGVQGTTTGLDDHGFLLIRYDDGQTQRLSTGGIRPVPLRK